MKNLIWLVVVWCGLLVSGCVSPREAITTPTPSLYLERAVGQRTTRGLTAWFIFSPGEYRAVSRDAEGIYYEPVSSIIYNGRPAKYLVLVSPDGRHAISSDDTLTDWLAEPLPFRDHP